MEQAVELGKRLEKHPHIQARLAVLLDVIENSSGEFEKADDVESALIDGLRQIGHDLLQDWAITQNTTKELQAKHDNNLKCHTKKKSTGILHLE